LKKNSQVIKFYFQDFRGIPDSTSSPATFSEHTILGWEFQVAHQVQFLGDASRFRIFRSAISRACGRKRLDFRAKKNGILAPTQYGFRKRRGTRDCLALLTTDISTSFEMKRQTVVAFLNISGAYDNVLINFYGSF
jgi:hypothetical protein